MADVAKW